LSKLLDAARTHGTAVANKSSRLAVPLRINPVDGVLQDSRRAVIIFRGDEDKGVRGGDRAGPAFYGFILVGRAAGHRGRHRLGEKRHWKITQVEQPRFDGVALLEVLKNPLCGLLGKPALTRAPDDYRNDSHVRSFAGFVIRAFADRRSSR